jgi:DNA polymerase-3 subunit alpha
MEMIRESDGNDRVIIYIKGTKEKKVLPPNLSVLAGKELVEMLSEKFGEENVKVTL